ncbi:MAG: MGH1-like glycoside hydrolase domain-containing protein [Aristaeellaceae bacterium]
MHDWDSHDIDLPSYGPYNKEYVGFSHVADPERGLRLDVDVLPGFYRRAVMDTRAITDSGARLWHARPDLTRFVYRYELLQPHQLYLETDFSQEGSEAAVRCTFVNHTALPQSVQVDFCFSVRVPTFYHWPLTASEVSVPEGCAWVSAAAYVAQEGLTGITHDGFRLGERPEPGAVKGCLMHLPAGQTVRLQYAFSPVEADHLMLRYRADADTTLLVDDMPVTLPASPVLTTVTASLPRDCYTGLTLTHSGEGLLLDGFAIGLNAGETAFTPWPEVFAPAITRGEREMTLRYPLLPQSYTIRWDAEDYVLRELLGEQDGDILTRNIHNHVSLQMTGSGKGHFADLFVRPVFLAPHESRSFTLLISAGGTPRMIDPPALPDLSVNPCAEPLRFSMARLRASTALNVVYPAYYRGRYIHSYTPGRIWDSFYTWDCGMIALGLLTMDRQRALECLQAYLMPQDDPHSPYLNHGSPLLTQMFAFKQLTDAGDMEACGQLYPALQRAYRYFLTLPRHGGLIATWEIFYNSGGWDDYPTQKYMHEHCLTGKTAPVIVTSMTLICGSILQNAARRLGLTEDIAAYDADRQELSAALAPCWDAETGYFGYSTDDGEGHFAGILRDEAGVNPNQGLDGLYPLLAGVGTAAQRRRMLDNIRKGLVTPVGLSVVDTRSPYFIRSGYWNGSVWMPHQWIVWKALLDMGEDALAHRIARTAMRLWKRETGVNGNCYEHFMLTNGRGAGFHHFSGLSSPVLSWFQSYYTPGTVSAGLRTAIVRQTWNADCTGVELTVEADNPRAVVIVTLREGCDYQLTEAPQGAQLRRVHPGTYCLRVGAAGTQSCIIRPV